ncbi:uncharacterized protein LOC120357772 [Solenopsis invicta]|uniref:uncharacterized protein LOC120357772 n=1 Tax=Solenopsis invicta TaxID=13686 RepID=UPI00193D2AF0|nr:uncharacterized protein LOC120357772 [Solenopsis invicta]
MGHKRKLSSEEEKENRLGKKLKRLEEKLKEQERLVRQLQEKHNGSRSSPNSRSSRSSRENKTDKSRSRSQSYDQSHSREYTQSPDLYSIQDREEKIPPPIESTEISEIPSMPSNKKEKVATTETLTIPTLTKEVLEAMGKRLEPNKKRGPIHADIVTRWDDILQKGLLIKDCKKIYEKYPVPENCIQYEPPTLNKEIKASLAEAILAKDKRKNRKRRLILMANLNPTLKETLVATKPGEWLFGSDLTEILKAAKFLEKSSKDLKPVAKNTATTSLNGGGGASKTIHSSRKELQSSQVIVSEVIPQQVQQIQETSSSLIASIIEGRLKSFSHIWKRLFMDKKALEWTKGYTIPFCAQPIQTTELVEPRWSDKEKSQMKKQINELLQKGAIQPCKKYEDQFFSRIFLVPKPDGSSHFILNLKKLNEFIKTEHFKLEDIRTARDLIQPNCFMATIDLKDAYYLVPIAETNKKFLRFIFDKQIYEFNCLPFGLSTAPFVFTKLMKPPITRLREHGFTSVIYLDDILLLGESKEKCTKNVQETRLLLEKLGFIINDDKSSRYKIREFASLVGTLSSCCLATKYGWPHIKDLEREKFLALRNNADNFEAQMKLTPRFVTEIFSDASRSGWGASCNNAKTHGFWNSEEQQHHINYLELQAAFFGLKCFAKDFKNCNILLRIDNTTAISYINRMGGIQFEHLSKVAKEIWSWCEQRNIWIFASYICSEDNVIADQESRRIEPDIEYSLSQKAFKQLYMRFGKPTIDLFATRINNKCSKYVSWKQDPGSIAIDAFIIDWNHEFFYAFPPFALIPKVLKKIRNDNARGILVIPNWPSQAWFSQCIQMFESKPIIFKPSFNLLSSSNRAPYPLWSQLSLVGGISSNRRTS